MSLLNLLVFISCILYAFGSSQSSTTRLHAPKNPSLEEIFAFIDKYHPVTNLYNDIGDCDFPITANPLPVAQEYFNMGICMLHSFWPSEAIRAFRQVVLIDSKCAIAYWGLHQALNWDHGYMLARENALALAEEYFSLASPREQLYIQADLPGNDWNATYQLLMQKYPDDINAKSFWAWGEVARTIHYMDAPLPGRTEIQQFLKTQTSLHPTDIGLQHYTIHAWEDTSFPYQALSAVEVVTKLAPNAGHIVHMPGHIYYLLGDHDTAHEAFLLGQAADERAMSNFSVTFQEYWEYIHNIAYMTDNLGESGRLTEALHYATFLQELYVDPNLPLLLDWDPIYNRPAARYYFQGLVALPLLHFQYANWPEAQTALSLMLKFLAPTVNNTQTAWLLDYYDALRQYACVMGTFATNDTNTAVNCLARLQSLFVSLGPIMNRTNENGFQVGARSYASLAVNVQEAVGVINAISGKWDDAVSALVIANASEAKIPYNEPPVYTRPVLATLAQVLLRRANVSGNPQYAQQALVVYRQILASSWHNNSGFGWFGVGYSYAQLNNVTQAKIAFNTFLNVWQSADQDLYQVVYARLYIGLAIEPETNQTSWYFMKYTMIALVGFVAVTIYGMDSRRRKKIGKWRT